MLATNSLPPGYRMRFVPRLILFALVLVCAPAWSQDDPLDALSDAEAAQVLELLQLARSAEVDGRWLEAWEAYREVHRIVAMPEVRTREAAALVELGRFDDAAAVYAVLIEGGGDAGQIAAERLAALDVEHPAVVEVQILGAPANLTVGTADLGIVEGTRAVEVPPGTYDVVVEASSYAPVSYQVTLGYGEVDSRVFTFAATAAAPPAPEVEEPAQPSGGSDLTVPLTLGVASAGSFALGGIMIARREAAADAVLDEVGDGLDSTRYEELGRRYDRSNAVAIAGFAAGGALAVAAIVTAVVRPGEDEGDLAVAPWFGTGGAGTALRVRW